MRRRPRRAPPGPQYEEALHALRETRGQVSEETYRETEAAIHRRYGAPPPPPGLRALLLTPERFMAQRTREGMAFGLPAASTLLLGALGNLNIYNLAPKELTGQFFREPPLLALAILGALGFSIFTGLLTAIYRVMAVLLGGGGTYIKMLELVGAATLPLTLSQALLLPLGLQGLPRETAAPLAGLTLIPFVTWYFYLLLQAVKQSTGLTMDRAAAAILIPLTAGAAMGALAVPFLQNLQPAGFAGFGGRGR